jgi:murein L,D-transpeptidase YcbB/YkuD
MKKIIVATLLLLSAFADAAENTVFILGFQTMENVETVKVRTSISYTGEKVLALWTSTDLQTWTRCEPEYGQENLIQVNPRDPGMDYYVRKIDKAFFKIDTYIPKGGLFTRDLTIGSTGPDVAELQTFLQEKGHMHWYPYQEKGYFGNQTVTAITKYQLSMGISSANGYFGPVTRAHVNSQL